MRYRISLCYCSSRNREWRIKKNTTRRQAGSQAHALTSICLLFTAHKGFALVAVHFYRNPYRLRSSLTVAAVCADGICAVRETTDDRKTMHSYAQPLAPTHTQPQRTLRTRNSTKTLYKQKWNFTEPDCVSNLMRFRCALCNLLKVFNLHLPKNYYITQWTANYDQDSMNLFIKCINDDSNREKRKAFEDDFFLGSWPIARTHTTDCCADTIPTGARFHQCSAHQKLVEIPWCRNQTHSSLVSMVEFAKRWEIHVLSANHNDINAIDLCKCQLMMNSMAFGLSIYRPVCAGRPQNFVRLMLVELSSLRCVASPWQPASFDWYTTDNVLCVCVIFHLLVCSEFSLRQD